LSESPLHLSKLDRSGIVGACAQLAAIAKRAREADVTLVIQPGIVESINERGREFGIIPLVLEQAS